MRAEHPEGSPTRQYALMAIKLAVSVALLAFLFSRIDLGQLWASAFSKWSSVWSN